MIRDTQKIEHALKWVFKSLKINPIKIETNDGKLLAAIVIRKLKVSVSELNSSGLIDYHLKIYYDGTNLFIEHGRTKESLNNQITENHFFLAVAKAMEIPEKICQQLDFRKELMVQAQQKLVKE